MQLSLFLKSTACSGSFKSSNVETVFAVLNLNTISRGTLYRDSAVLTGALESGIYLVAASR